MKHNAATINWEHWQQRLQTINENPRFGRVVQVIGLGIEADGPDASVGEVVEISARGGQTLLAEVVGFRSGRVLLMPLGDASGIGPGSLVTATDIPFQVAVSEALLGRVLDGLGRPIDGKQPIEAEAYRPAEAKPPPPLQRKRITAALPLGIRSIDGFCTIGKGQRIGIFAGSGVGKSTLLGMVARGTTASVNVIAMVGERGREVRDFIEQDLGPDGLARSVVIVATSDQPALIRVRAAFVATAIAEYFRDSGHDVLLMMDSVTRFAMAQREVGLTAGEPPTTKGYPPSVFALLPRLLERVGSTQRGSITGVYSVLVDGDDMNDPVADALRSILDGHVVLARRLAERNQYPAVDVLASVSRLMSSVATEEHQQCAAKLRDVLAAYREAEDLIQIGAYAEGSDPRVDEAIKLMPSLEAFLIQAADYISTWDATLEQLKSVQPAS